MKNLPILQINASHALFKIPSKGDLKNEYDSFKNLQLDTGEIIPFNTDKIKFDLNHPLQIDIQPSYDGSVNLIINDDKNPPLLINSRFSVQEGNTYEIIDHIGTADTNLYWEDSVNLDTRLYKTITKIPKLDFLGLELNGKLKCGTYHFYFKYSDNDGNETDFITESGVVTCHIGNINDPFSIRMGMQDENSEKIIKFKLSNIDTQYDLIKVYFTRTTSDNSAQDITTAHYIDSKYIINSETLDLNITGFENIIDISIDEINPQYQLVDSAKAQAKAQNILFLGNVNKPSLPYQELSDLSLRIIPSISNEKNIGNLDSNYIDRSGRNLWEYYNVNNIYNYLGYWPEEYYRFGIVYILPDFTLSPVFNIRGLDFSIGNQHKSFDLYDNENKRVYINSLDGLINNRINYFENSKGVIKLPKQQVITSEGVTPIGLKFTFGESENDTSIINELKKYTKGFFFVRQERIPTILAQGCAIGKTKDEYGNIPIIPYNGIGIAESFLKTTTFSVNNLSDDNILLVKDWKWRFPDAKVDGTNNDINDDNFIDVTTDYDPYIKKDGARIKSKNKLPERIGNGLFGYWDIDESATEKLINLYGQYLRILESKFLNIPYTNYEIKAAIVPEAELRESIFNQLFTSSEYIITKTLEQGQIAKISDIHYQIIRDTVLNDNTLKTVLLTMVNDGLKLTTNGTDYFSARAGESEQAWETIDVLNNWLYSQTENGINTKLTQSDSLIRGNFGTYVGIGNSVLSPGEIFNVRPKGYNETLKYKENEFKNRFYTSAPYYSISDRQEFNENSIICYRGDCYIGNFTHKMHRNFIDPELPLNDRIIDPYTWHKNYSVYQDSSVDNKAVNRILTTFKRNNKGKILEPSDAKYTSAGGLKDTLTGGESFKISGSNNINRADVNAVKLGHWFTFKVMSNVNVSMRDINLMEPAEQSIFGQPRSFFPLQKMNRNSSTKIADSNIINGANNVTLSKRYNFIIPDVPFLKNKFDTRIIYSDIHITDAFRNGFRVFKENNYRDYPKTYGALISLKEFNGNLIAVMENGVLLIPINERALAGEGVGGNIYINTSNVLPENPKVLSSNFGSIWQDSIIITTENKIYGVDTIAKKIWRTDGQSFEIISDLKVQKFLNDNINLKESDKIPIIGIKNVKTHYNSFKGDIMFTFYNDDKIWNLCYNERLEKFITFYSWTPVYSENINNIFFSFDLNDIKSSIVLKENINSVNKLELSNNGYNKNLVFDNYILPYDFNRKVANVITSDVIQLDNSFFKIVNKGLYYNDLNSFNSFFASTDTYKSISILLPTDCTLKFVKNTLDTHLWKHGQAGIYNLQGEIKPTKWYNKQEVFELEFIIKDPPIYQKIFNNLKIISNKSKPKEFEFEIVGEGYDWYNYKDIIQLLNDRVGEADYPSLEISYLKYLQSNQTIKKLPFIKRVRYNPNNPLKDYKWENNSTDVWLVNDTLLNEERIHTNQLGNDIKTLGRINGNMQYLEDFWNIEIRPINFKYAYLNEGVLKFTPLKQSKLRDKYLKIKVRYSGEDLTIVQAIKTLFTISYS